MKHRRSPSLVSHNATTRVRPARTLSRLALSALLLALGGPAARADWPEFRGPRGDGQVSALGDTKPLGLPLHWSETNNIKWKTAIPFRRWSTPGGMGGQGLVTN